MGSGWLFGDIRSDLLAQRRGGAERRQNSKSVSDSESFYEIKLISSAPPRLCASKFLIRFDFGFPDNGAALRAAIGRGAEIVAAIRALAGGDSLSTELLAAAEKDVSDQRHEA